MVSTQSSGRGLYQSSSKASTAIIKVKSPLSSIGNSLNAYPLYTLKYANPWYLKGTSYILYFSSSKKAFMFSVKLVSSAWDGLNSIILGGGVRFFSK